MKIAGVDLDREVFIVAELSANHGGSLDLALKSLEAIKECGANAVKIQTYTPSSLTIDCKKPDFIIKQNTIWDGKSFYELYEQAQTPRSWHAAIFEKARELDLICFSSPFSRDDALFLEQFNPPAYKVASFEAIDTDFVEFLATLGKPLIISAGIARLGEIEAAVSIAQKHGAQVAILKCTSAYPAPPDLANLNTIKDLKAKFPQAVIGFSDHTLGSRAATLAVALGARFIEKHFVLDKSVQSADASFSLDKQEFAELVREIRLSEQLLGRVSYGPTESARELARSLYAIADIKKGETLTRSNIGSIRPGFGLHPKFLQDLLGKPAKKALQKGDRLDQSLL